MAVADGLRFRQVHLDFHTSEHIAGIGAEFDAEDFASTLEAARVDSITCFARGHHGWVYYNTEAFPERRHPHLERDLLREQIAACHARGIRVPIYVTVQWDHYTARQHPEWLVMDDRGCPVGTPIDEPGFYRKLCLDSPYVDFLKSHVAEILETMPVDGFFFDIVQPQDCSCRYCTAGMKRRGLDPFDQAARKAYGLGAVNDFKQDLTRFVHQFDQECTVFYNAGHVGPRHRDVVGAYTHFELESLPSGGWGYLHFPLAVRYARTLGPDCLGMTGKFHTSWGDFHSFKNDAALQFECFQMLAQGAGCSVGDQLHPSGKIDTATYDLIGSVYREVERKEPWCTGARPVTEIGVLTPEEFSEERLPPAALGAVRVLQEGAYQFDVLDSRSDFSQYRLLVLPDRIPAGEGLARRLDSYLSDGGSLVASYRSGLNEEGSEFAVGGLGLRLIGEAPYSPDFILPRGEIGAGLPSTEHVMYLRGLAVEAEPDSEVLADGVMPYFNRTARHFVSHRHTPSAGTIGYPAIVRKGQAIYFAHPVFTQYNANAPRWCKTLVHNAIRLLLPNPLVRVEGPSGLVATLLDQPEHNRRVVHLLYYVPERRGEDFDVIEDVVPLHDIPLSVTVPREVTRVRCVPAGSALAHHNTGDRVDFVVPKLLGHQMIELAFAEGLD